MIDVGRELGKHVDAAALSRARVRFDGAELPCAAPDSVAGIAEVVRFAARERLAVVPTGLGSKLGWTPAPERADLLLSTRRYAGVVAHVPDDGTIALRAGTTMAEARRVAREGGHWLTPDVPHPERKTLGGVIAAGESGADRLRFGPVRHHVLGLEVVLADGTLTRCGGRLVKNVTGFDLMRLYTGSRGTLCVIVEAALRLFAAPEHEVAISVSADGASGALDLARAALALPIRPAAVAVASDEGTWIVTAHILGRRAPVEAERELLMRAWPRADVQTGDAARAAIGALRDRRSSGDRPWLRATCAPSRCAATLREISARLDAARIEHRAVAHPGLADLEFELLGSFDEPARLVAFVREARVALAELDASLEVRDAPSAALSQADPLGAAPPGLDLMRELKRALDPDRVFASDRFAAGL